MSSQKQQSRFLHTYKQKVYFQEVRNGLLRNFPKHSLKIKPYITYQSAGRPQVLSQSGPCVRSIDRKIYLNEKNISLKNVKIQIYIYIYI